MYLCGARSIGFIAQKYKSFAVIQQRTQKYTNAMVPSERTFISVTS